MSELLLNKRLLGLLIVGLLLRLGYGAYVLSKTQEPMPDPDSYAALAESFATHWSLLENGSPSAHREPGYPVLLGLCFKIFGANYMTALSLNAVLSECAIWLLFLLGQRFFDERVAWIAAIIATFYPPFIFYTAQTLREIMMSALSLAGVYAILPLLCSHPQAKGGSRMGSNANLEIDTTRTNFEVHVSRLFGFARAGAVNAIAALTNTTFLPFGLLMAPLGLVFLRRNIPNLLRGLVIYWVVLIGLYSLWPIRNYLQLKTLVLGSTAGAASTFYMYLIVPQEIGGTPEQEAIVAKDPVLQAGNRMNRLQQEPFFWKAGMDWICRHPIRYMKLVAWRLVDFWRLWPRERSYPHSYTLLKWISLLTDGWIIPLGFFGMLWSLYMDSRLRGNDEVRKFCREEAILVYFQLGSVWFIYALIFTTLRYRVALMPWMILFAASSLVKGWRRWLHAR